MTNNLTLRTVPAWMLKADQVVCKEEQLAVAPAHIEIGQIKLHDPTSHAGWTTYGDIYARVREYSLKKTRFLGVEHINDLLSRADELPEEWKGFHIQLWGQVFRGKWNDKDGHMFVKHLYFCEENRVWLVGNTLLTGFSYGEPLDKSLTTLDRGTHVRIAYVE